MPAFSPELDTYASLRTRNKLLFDTIITFGSRAAHGPLSQTYRLLHSLLRERICNLVLAPIDSTSAGLEAIQVLLVHACYSDNGWLLVPTAIRIAVELDLPNSVEDLLVKVMNRKRSGLESCDDEEASLFRMARIWCALFNLEQMCVVDPSSNINKNRRLTSRTSYQSGAGRWQKPECNLYNISAPFTYFMYTPTANID